jgi:hypothetical protein
VSDAIDDFRALKQFRALVRKHFGVPCPCCQIEQPKRQPTILEPGQRCRVHRPAYVDPRPELTQADIDTLPAAASVSPETAPRATAVEAGRRVTEGRE